MYLEWLLIAENFGVNGVFGANLAFLAQIWRFWRRFGANSSILDVIIVVSED
ncbi:hypothetical protein [Enterococcus innesii]|uniref:hypothetical protein n=1 Tax=Enterococcus innesii TaxID=2839759 RepID=UPI0034A45D91